MPRSGMMAAMLATAGAAAVAQDYEERRYFPDEEGWSGLFAVDLADGPLLPLESDETPLPAPRDAARYTVTFKGEILGFDVGSVALDVAVSDAAYELRYAMEQRGIAKFFSDANAQAHAAGTFDTDDPARPIDGSYYYNHDVESADDQQRVELYRPKGADRLRLWTEPVYWFHQPVPEAEARGATDPLGALVALGFPEAAPGRSPCERRARVYDGRKRFDLDLHSEGRGTIRKGGSGRYEGPAFKCRMTLTKVAGYRPKDRAEIEGSVWVYLAPVPERVRTPTFAYVPVLVTARQGVFGAKLEAKFPTITAPDGEAIALYEG